MITNPELLRAFEHSIARQDRPNLQRNIRIFESLYLEARDLGKFPLQDPLDGIQVDIHLAGVLNDRKPARSDRDSP